MLRLATLVLLFAVLPAHAQDASPADLPAAPEVPEAEQVRVAVLAAPEALREGATVLGWRGGELVELRKGQGELVCLADDPARQSFQVACYHASLEPFMRRGRELRARGLERDSLQARRKAEIAAGTLPMPEGPAIMYLLEGDSTSYDPAAGTLERVYPRYNIYIPYATPDQTGLPLSAPFGEPWLMNPGEPWAHIMLIPPRPQAED